MIKKYKREDFIVKRKLLAGILSIIMVASLLSGCGKTPADSKTEGSSAKKNYKVYLITMDQMDQHWVNMDKGCKKAVDELGNVTYKWTAPDVKDDAKQIECINNAVADGANAILLAANGPTAAGKTAGEKMLEALKAKNITKGKIGIINVNSATQSTVDREKGFRSAFEGAGYEILETQYCEGDAAKAKDIASNYITQGCVGIFGANEGSSTGAGNAIKESGKKDLVGVGFDKSNTLLGLVKDGYLACTMAQNPDIMGYDGVKAAVDALNNVAAKQTKVDTGVSVIDKDAASKLLQ